MIKPSRVLGLGLFGFICQSFPPAIAAAPDLIVWGDAAAPYIETVTYASDSCEVQEGCAVAGTRKLLRFNMETRNIGNANLHVGNPANNPLFHWAPCHGHYHFDGFALYELLDANGQLAAQGHKIGFCIEDVHRWDPNAPAAARYDCNNDGIQAGWADVYEANLPCQYVDITGVPPGDYLLHIIVNPDQLLPESNYSNNDAQVPVTISGTCEPPANDSFASATFIYNFAFQHLGNTACASRQPEELPIAGNPGGHSVWYRWIAPVTMRMAINTAGSGFDTLLGVYSFTGGGLNVVAENDDLVQGVIRWSSVTFNASAGVEYRIAVDGFDGDFGPYVLNMSPPANDLFENCANLAGASGTINGYTIGASIEPNEPSHNSTFGLHSVWYCWSPPAAGTYIFDTVGSDFSTALAVYTGANLDGLTVVAGDNHSGPNGASRVQFEGRHRYHVSSRHFRAWGQRWQSGLKLECVELPVGGRETRQ